MVQELSSCCHIEWEREREAECMIGWSGSKPSESIICCSSAFMEWESNNGKKFYSDCTRWLYYYSTTDNPTFNQKLIVLLEWLYYFSKQPNSYPIHIFTIIPIQKIQWFTIPIYIYIYRDTYHSLILNSIQHYNYTNNHLPIVPSYLSHQIKITGSSLQAVKHFTSFKKSNK